MTSKGRGETKPQSSRKERKVVEAEGLFNYVDWLMWEATDGPSSSHPRQDQESDSNDDLFEQVEAFEGGEEEGDVLKEVVCYQSDEGDLTMISSQHSNIKCNVRPCADLSTHQASNCRSIWNVFHFLPFKIIFRALVQTEPVTLHNGSHTWCIIFHPKSL